MAFLPEDSWFEKKAALLLLFTGLLTMFHCTGTSNTGFVGKEDLYHNVTLAELKNEDLAKSYENQAVRFKASFERIIFLANLDGMGRYRMTHNVISVTDQDENVKMSNILVPSNNAILPSLNPGDLLQIEAEVKLSARRSGNIFIYLPVKKLKRLRAKT